ncbi:MAG TPA: hypothetical protein VKF38_06150 [Anaerolineaceae bacterium]|nr:hypothetical protein [Anaerolineaceae bacterium]
MSDPNYIEISKTLTSASSLTSIECHALLKTEIVYGQTNIAVITLDQDGKITSDIYLELMDGKLTLYVWDQAHIDGKSPIIKQLLTEIKCD